MSLNSDFITRRESRLDSGVCTSQPLVRLYTTNVLFRLGSVDPF